MSTQAIKADNVTDFVSELGTSATLSIQGVDPEKEINDIVDLLEKVFVEVYASGFKKMITELMQHMAETKDIEGIEFDWLPTAEDWAYAKLDIS